MNPYAFKLYHMLDVAESQMSRWLNDPDGWKSVLIDYEKPTVERLWRSFDNASDYRVFLHRIEPCLEQESLWHPHPWPSIVRVVRCNGEYVHRVGYDRHTDDEPPVAIEQRIRGTVTYVIDDPNTWHSVACSQESWSIMVVGKPFSA